jgi:hypothetical protein
MFEEVATAGEGTQERYRGKYNCSTEAEVPRFHQGEFGGEPTTDRDMVFWADREHFNRRYQNRAAALSFPLDSRIAE